MPAERKGFLFSHFEKIICAVVALAVLLALYYMNSRSKGERITELVTRIANATNDINRQWNAKAPDIPCPDYLGDRAKAYAVPTPMEITRQGLDYLWPIIYRTMEIGTEKGYVLSFYEPLDFGSVKIVGEDPPGQVIEPTIEHPADGSYAKARIRTKTELESGQLGRARIVGMAGGREHIHPVVVNPRIDPQPLAPLNVRASAQRGYVLVVFEPNPENKKREVGVTYYEVFRKNARHLVGDFSLVGRVKADKIESTGTRPAAGGPGPAGGAGARPEMMWPDGRGGLVPPVPEAMARPAEGGEGVGDAEKKKVRYGFRDTAKRARMSKKDPGPPVADEEYFYKVRTVGTRSMPPQSEFTEEVQVKTPANVEWRFLGVSGRRLRFEVAVWREGHTRKSTFYNEIGEQIGGILQDKNTGAIQNFLTQNYLVDHHPNVMHKKGNATVPDSRVIYVDRRGDLQSRWKRETDTPELFADQKVKPDAREGREGREGPSPYGPMPGPEVLHPD